MNNNLKIILSFFLGFVLNSCYSQNKSQGSKDSSLNSCFKNGIETFKRTSCGQENIANLKKFIQNIPIETYFILTLKIRFAKLNMFYTCKHNKNS